MLIDRDSWTTPQKLFDWLDHWFGCAFTLDAAASDENTKCPRFWDKDIDALKQDWNIDERIWCNPPYSMAMQFAAKLHEAKNCVMLLPVRSDRIWFQNLLSNPEIDHMWVTGRLHFGGSGKGAFMYSILFFKGFKSILLRELIPLSAIDAAQFNDNGRGGARC